MSGIVIFIMIFVPVAIAFVGAKILSKRADVTTPNKLKNVIRVFYFLGILSFIFSIFAFVSLFSVEEDFKLKAFTMNFMIGSIISSFLFIFTAYKLQKRKKWARILAILISILMIPGFPIGTLVGIYSLIILLRKETTQWFSKEAIT